MSKLYQEWLFELPARPKRIGMLGDVFEGLDRSETANTLYVLFEEPVDLEPLLKQTLESVHESN